MKRPLKPEEVPPGSVLRFKTCENPQVWASPIIVTESGVVVAVENGSQMTFLLYYTLKANWLIKRPGEDWQECAVDEFNPSDYKPGQEVDVEVAQKLYDAGVKLEYQNDRVYPWCSVESLSGNLKNFGSVKFRVATESFDPNQYKPGQNVDVATAQKLYDAGVKLLWAWKKYPNEFSPVKCFDEDDWNQSILFRIALPTKLRDIRPDELPPKIIVSWPNMCEAIWHNPSERDIRRAVEGGAKWSTNLDGPLHEFWKEE